MGDSIFVSMAGYEEDYIWHTIESAMQTADEPSRVWFGVSEHRRDTRFYKPTFDNVRVVNEVVDRPLGVSGNRNAALSLYGGEKYILNIDPHTLFVDHWDTDLAAAYEYGAGKVGHRSIMTYHLPSAIVSEGKLVPTTALSIAGPMSFNVSGNTGPRSWTQEEIDIGIAVHYGFSGHNQFSLAENILAFKFDPEIFFYGEEQAMAMRYCTNGYTIFVTRSSAFGFHLDKRGNAPNWRFAASHNGKPADDYTRIRAILVGEYFGKYGAPNKEALSLFLSQSNLNVKRFLYL